MMRSGTQILARCAIRPSSSIRLHTGAGRKFISTEAAHLKSRSWKSSALRWGVAVAGIYYYNTSPVFAEHPQNNLLNPNVDALHDEYESSTLEALTASSRRKAEKNPSVLQSAIEKSSEDDAASSTPTTSSDASTVVDSPADLEEEAGREGAFNPVTGEINWDCPCLGGMAHGPCGPEFKEAFSCFVFSTEEPKGMDCIDKFQKMQTCFRAHPEVYQGELEDDEELDAELAQEREQLQQQIADRKSSDDTSEKNEVQVADSTAARGTSSKTDISDKAPSTTPAKASSSEPHPGMSEEHESINEGQTSSVRSTPGDRPIESASTSEDQTLVPRAAYSATQESSHFKAE